MIPAGLVLAFAGALGAWFDVTEDPLAAPFASARYDAVIDAAYLRLGNDAVDPDAQYWLGRASYERGLALLDAGSFGRDLGQALLDRAIEALALAPSDSDASEWLDLARWVRGDGDGEDETFARELATRAESGDAHAAYVHALLERDAGRLVEASTWLERALEIAPDRRAFLLESALVSAARGRVDAALVAWRRARDGEAPHEELLGVLAQLLPERRDAERRLALIDALEVEPTDPLRCWYRGYALWELGRGDEAVAAMETAGPGRGPAFERAHAQFLLAASRPEQAAARLRPLVADGDPAALEILCSVADTLAIARRFEPALAAYEACLDLSPRHGRATVNRALTLSQAGRSSEASAAYAEVLSYRPGRADLLNDAALHAWGQGQAEQARTLWEEAIELPGSADARENLAVSLRKIDPVRAVKLLDEVLAAEPERDRALYQWFLGARGPR